MYALYVANKNYSSWSLRPWVLLKTLGISFEERFTPFLEGSSYEVFRKFSPTGLVPCLIDDGTVVWDSLGIVEYVAEDHPQIWPASRIARAWARSAAAEMHSGFSTLRNICTMNIGVRARLNEMSAPLKKDVQRIDDLWSEGLTRFGGPFLAGDAFTAVDAFFAPVAFRVQTYGLNLGSQAAEYADRLLALPAMQEWYAAGIAETMRETDHEKELRHAAAITADYRAAPQPASE